MDMYRLEIEYLYVTNMRSDDATSNSPVSKYIVDHNATLPHKVRILQTKDQIGMTLTTNGPSAGEHRVNTNL